jgi:3-hydroxymyristoyl/3-hydroxydecanoyl-(acyl carrier protein) dehydratase
MSSHSDRQKSKADDPRLASALASLPHGSSFRFLDRLTQLEPGIRGSAEYRVRGDEAFLAGHFPGEPMFPGVLLIEAAAQLAGTVAQSDLSREPLKGLKLTAVKGAKIRGTAVPGETLRLAAEITGRLDNLVQAKATVAVGSKTVLQVELTLGGAKVS